MKSLFIHIALTLALGLVLAGCFGSGEPNGEPVNSLDASDDAPQDASTGASQNVARTGPRVDPYARFNVRTYVGPRIPADPGADAGTDAGADLGADAHTGADAGSDTGRGDAGRDADRDAGRDAGPRADMDPDAGVETPDLGPPPPPPTPWIFETEELGVLVEADEGTVAEEVAAPAWSANGIASANFERPGEEIYSVIVYEDENAARAEVGDSFASDRTVTTASGHTGYVYETNDFGALPDIHATIQTENFVYYFHSESEEENFEVPEDFLNFIRELELR